MVLMESIRKRALDRADFTDDVTVGEEMVAEGSDSLVSETLYDSLVINVVVNLEGGGWMELVVVG